MHVKLKHFNMTTLNWEAHLKLDIDWHESHVLYVLKLNGWS